MQTDKPFKRLLEIIRYDLAAWLLNAEVVRVTPRPVALPARREARYADDVLAVELRDGSQLLLHVELQARNPSRAMHWRMAEYMLGLSETTALPLYTVVIYLLGAGADDHGQHHIASIAGTALSWQYRVVRLWQMPARDLLRLQRPTLLPFAGQMQIAPAERQTIVNEVVRQMQSLPDEHHQQTVLYEFLSLCRDAEVSRMLREIIEENQLPELEGMRALREDWQAEGRVEGRAEGRVEGLQKVVLRQLTRRVGTMDAATTTRITALDSDRLLALADALLDFATPADLAAWLATHAPDTTPSEG